MKKLEVFDPALCCSSGVCGPSPDQQLMAFAGVVKSLEGKAEVHRYNLAQQPAAFSGNAAVQQILQEDGTEALPAILIDGKLAMKGVYPSKQQLNQLLGLAAKDDACCAPEDAADSSCCAPADSDGAEEPCGTPGKESASSCC